MSWNWYSGGWDDAAAGHPGPLFQYHHQPFNYFAAYAPGQPGRAHLQDETAVPHRRAPGHAADRQLRQAVRRRERAPRLRQRAGRQRPPRRPAQGGHHRPAGQGHPRGRDVRRVRRPVGPRRAARAGHDSGRPRRLGPGHPHPGAGAVAPRCGAPAWTTTVYDTTSILATIEHSLHAQARRDQGRPGQRPRPRRRARPLALTPTRAAPTGASGGAGRVHDHGHPDEGDQRRRRRRTGRAGTRPGPCPRPGSRR